MNQVAITHTQWRQVCQRSDLVADSGVCALVGDRQVALFFLPDFLPEREPQLYAIDNWDPLAEASVIARGLVAELEGEPTVASPLYKHHYSLLDGRCLEDSEVRLATYPVALDGDQVLIDFPQD